MYYENSISAYAGFIGIRISRVAMGVVRSAATRKKNKESKENKEKWSCGDFFRKNSLFLRAPTY
jgi:hypothetical protein